MLKTARGSMRWCVRIVVLWLLCVRLVTVLRELYVLRWYRYAAVALEATDPDTRAWALQQFYTKPTDRLPHELYVVLTKSAVFTAPWRERRIAAGHMGYWKGPEALEAAQCLLSVLLYGDPPPAVQISAEASLARLYRSGNSEVTIAIRRRLAPRIAAGDECARHLASFCLNDPGLCGDGLSAQGRE